MRVDETRRQRQAMCVDDDITSARLDVADFDNPPGADPQPPARGGAPVPSTSIAFVITKALDVGVWLALGLVGLEGRVGLAKECRSANAAS